MAREQMLVMLFNGCDYFNLSPDFQEFCVCCIKLLFFQKIKCWILYNNFALAKNGKYTLLIIHINKASIHTVFHFHLKKNYISLTRHEWIETRLQPKPFIAFHIQTRFYAYYKTTCVPVNYKLILCLETSCFLNEAYGLVQRRKEVMHRFLNWTCNSQLFLHISKVVVILFQLDL